MSHRHSSAELWLCYHAGFGQQALQEYFQSSSWSSQVRGSNSSFIKPKQPKDLRPPSGTGSVNYAKSFTPHATSASCVHEGRGVLSCMSGWMWRIQMMTGTAIAILPTSASFCIIFLMRPWQAQVHLLRSRTPVNYSHPAWKRFEHSKVNNKSRLPSLENVHFDLFLIKRFTIYTDYRIHLSARGNDRCWCESRYTFKTNTITVWPVLLLKCIGSNCFWCITRCWFTFRGNRDWNINKGKIPISQNATGAAGSPASS